MKKATRRLAVGSMVAVLAMAVSGCALSSAAAPEESSGIQGGDLEGVTFAYALPSAAAQVYVQQQEEFVRLAESLGATVQVYDNNGDAATMLSNAQLMVAAKPDFIVEFPSSADATDRVGETFASAGIPCIALNIPVDGCSYLNYDQPALAKLAAETMAGFMGERGWDATNTTVVIGQASTLGDSVNVAVRSFYSSLSELVPGMTRTPTESITASTTAIPGTDDLQSDMGLTVESGFAAMNVALQTIPAGNNIIVYPVSDDTTQGIVRALEGAGRSDQAMVSGYGGDTAALEALRAGDKTWVMDQVGFFTNWGEFVLAMAVAMSNEAEMPAMTVPPQVVITSDNVDTYYEPGSAKVMMMPALPQESEYLLETGVLQEFGNVEGAS